MSREDRIALLKSELGKDPSDVFYNYALGLEYASAADSIEKSRTQFQKVIGLDANYVAAYYQLGRVFEQLEKPALALDAYRKGLEIARRKKDLKTAGEFEAAISLLED
jgi:tetratricopeptide (TPR) repeat protein